MNEQQNQNEKGFLIEDMTSELSIYVMNDFQLDLASALDAVYNSETYTKMCDENTHLMYQHPHYVYSYLKNELLTGRIG